METTAECLLRLQNLEDDLKYVDNESERKEIEDEIILVKTQIPSDIISRFYKLYRKNGDALVRANGGYCQGCFINLPTSQHTVMSHSEELHVCQNCGRFLYMDSEETVAIF